MRAVRGDVSGKDARAGDDWDLREAALGPGVSVGADTRSARGLLPRIRDEWGGPIGIEERAPTMAADPAFRAWWATYLRMGASPGAALALTHMNAEIDIRDILPSIRVPDAGPSSPPRSPAERRGRTVRGEPHPRRALCRVARPGSPPVCRRSGRARRRDRTLRDRRARRSARPPLDRVLATILHARVDGVAAGHFLRSRRA